MNFKLPEIDYDFRKFANPEDELQHLWDSWVEYYRVKAAIAKWLNPRNILEIGVRYGYSANAFLAGAPAADYIGIDANNGKSGGCENGFAWARRILPTTAVLIEADTRKMESLPGGIHDLIHVDGEQTGLSTYRDLELSSKQGRWILCDGYFWTAENFNAANDFLRRYKDVIEWSLVLPGYAGEMLIRIKDDYLAAQTGNPNRNVSSSQSLQTFYTSDYFLSDCGGYDSFHRYQGAIVSDARLTALTDLLFARNSGRVLDLGCGRGEISIQAALAGSEVTAVDYSESAIGIAEKAYASIDDPVGRIEWRCESLAELSLEGKYETVVCSDVIEHIAPTEVEALYALVARHLTDDGWFILHTFPNRWYYDYDYQKRRKMAQSMGAHLPFEPRSRYEKLMHINEQKPQVMRRQLRKYFPHVLFWFGTPDNPKGSLEGPFSLNDLAASRDLFAVASMKPVDSEAVVAVLSASRPLPAEKATLISVSVADYPDTLPSNARSSIRVKLCNGIKEKITSRTPWPIHLCYHWLSAADNTVSVFDGIRTPIGTLYPGQTRQIPLQIRTPSTKGDFVLQVRLVQENVRWHEGGMFSTSTQDCAMRIV